MPDTCSDCGHTNQPGRSRGMVSILDELGSTLRCGPCVAVYVLRHTATSTVALSLVLSRPAPVAA